MKKKENKTFSYKLHLTPTENERLKKKAEKVGISRAVLLRKYVNDEPILDKELRDQLLKLDISLARIGNNVNQIAHKWNESGSDMRDIGFLSEQMGDVYRLMKEVRDYCSNAHRGKRE